MPDLRFVDARTEAHFTAMSRIHARGWRTAYPGHVPDSYLCQITDDRWVPFFREDHATGRCRGLLLYDGTVPVACCNYGPARLGPCRRQSDGAVIPEDAYQGWGEIISFYTDPACTGLGFGSALMDEILRRLGADGYSSCFVFVLRENHGARRFYARHGFAWDGTGVELTFPPDSVCTDLRYIKTG